MINSLFHGDLFDLGVILIFGSGLLGLYLIPTRGWRLVAIKYPSTTKPIGKTYFLGIRFGGSWTGRYSSTYVKTIVSEDGLYFSNYKLFNKPILIPWNKIKILKRINWPIYKACVLEIEGMRKKITLSYPREEIGDALLKSVTN